MNNLHDSKARTRRIGRNKLLSGAGSSKTSRKKRQPLREKFESAPFRARKCHARCHAPRTDEQFHWSDNFVDCSFKFCRSNAFLERCRCVTERCRIVSAPFRAPHLHLLLLQCRGALESTLNVKINNKVWRKASLPISLGGIGIRSAVDIAPSAFISSVIGTSDQVQSLLPAALTSCTVPGFKTALDAWHSRIPDMQQPSSDRQKIWDNCLAQERLRTMVEEGAGPDKARLLACCQKESGAWLQAIPSASLGLMLTDSQLRVAVALRLGAEVCIKHTCHCGKLVLPDGHHRLSCRYAAGRWSRHGEVNSIVQRALTSAKVPSTLEPPGLSRDDGKRPDGMTQVPRKVGKHMVWDFTSVDTLAISHVASTAETPGAAATQAEKKKKTTKYSVLHQYHFQPIGVETLGSYGENAKAFIYEVGSRLIKCSEDSRARSFLQQRIGIAVQRGNAISILGTIASNSLDEYWYFNQAV